MKRVYSLAILILLTVVFPGVLIYADCPHCYNLIEVEITLADGTSNKGYIGYYGAYSDEVPLIEGNDIKHNILGAEWKRVSIKFYENVYFFKDIIFGVRQEDVEEVNLDDVKKIIYLSKTAFGGAGPVPLLSNKDIRLLCGEIYDVRRYSPGLCDLIYVNCNPEISSREFDFFFEFMKRYGEPSVQTITHPDYPLRLIERSEGNAKSIRDNLVVIQSEIAYLSELTDSLRERNQRSLVVKYIQEFKDKFVVLLRLSDALLDFLSSESDESYVLFEQDLLRIFDNVPEIKDMRFEINNSEHKWDKIKPLFDIIKVYYEDTYQEFCLRMFDECNIVFAVWCWD